AARQRLPGRGGGLPVRAPRERGRDDRAAGQGARRTPQRDRRTAGPAAAGARAYGSAAGEPRPSGRAGDTGAGAAPRDRVARARYLRQYDGAADPLRGAAAAGGADPLTGSNTRVYLYRGVNI